MTHRSSDSYGDLSFPEITTELWSQICHDEPELTNLSGASTINAISAESYNTEMDASIIVEYEEESDSALWDQVSEIGPEDLVQVEEIREQTPPIVKKAVPLYLILDKLFERLEDVDIEDSGLSVDTAANLISKYKSNGALSVTNLVQPMWSVAEIHCHPVTLIGSY